MSVLQNIYGHSSVFFQNIMCSVKGWALKKRRFGKDFFRLLSDYESHRVSPEESLESFLEAIRNVPAYKSVYEKAAQGGAKLSDFKIITKADVKLNYSDYINPDYRGKTILEHTSGTSGNGLVIPVSVEAERKQWAVWWRCNEDIGIKFGTWQGWLCGRQIIPLANIKPPYWRINWPGKRVMFSTYHLKPDTVHYFIDEINRRKLTWIHGYPSILCYLSRLAQQAGLQPVLNVKFVTTGSENLLPSDVGIIKKTFPNAMVRTHYGLTEAVSNISQNRDGEWVIDDDFAYTELIEIENSLENDASNSKIKRCRIIGTNFTNLAFPLVRYDTGDIAIVDCSNGKILGIEGRSDEFFILKNGTKFTAILAEFIFDEIEHLAEGQVRLKKNGDIELVVVKGFNYSGDDELKLLHLAHKHISEDLNITINYTDKIQRTKAGKLRIVVAE